MKIKRPITFLLVLEIALLLITTTLTYWPNLSKATIYRDDWYYTMDRHLGGPAAFPEMFSIDRPARGVFFEAYYQLFGIEPAPYHAVTLIFRLLAALSTLWLFRLLWPNQRSAAVFIALLFVIYPGYTRWMEGFEDQPKVVSIFLQVTSIALTLEAIRAKGGVRKVLLWIGSILTGWGYIALVDYAIGMEAFRFLCVFVFVNRGQLARSWIQKCTAALRSAAPALLIAGLFLFWRFFIFQNERPETDLALQLSVVTSAPLIKGSWLVFHMVQTILNVAVLAWAAPFFQDLFGMRLRDVAVGGFLALLVGVFVWFASSIIKKAEEKDPQNPPADCTSWQVEASWIGLIGVVAGVLPVIVANRFVVFGAYSHYALPAALAAATLITGILGLLSSRRVQVAVFSVLVILAVLNQFAASNKVLIEEQSASEFWHQMAWRAPGIKEGTSLAVNYGSVGYGEDVDAVNGPANLIYFPEPDNQLPVKYKLYALKQYDWTSKEVLGGGQTTAGYRTHYGDIDYDNLLVISRPSEESCVHVIDQRFPWYAYNERDTTLIIGSKSKVENILTDGPEPKLSNSIFTPEPAHGWCYYFEKAELAAQMNDWEKVAALENEAESKKLHPVERLEWIPFIQAYAILGDETAIRNVASKINETLYNKAQACSVLTNMRSQGYPIHAAAQEPIREAFCPDWNP